MKRRDDPNQLLIDWSSPSPAAPVAPDPAPAAIVAPAASPGAAAEAPIQRLPWDFATTFPEPTEEGVAAGLVDEDDRQPENLKALHEQHARETLAILRAIDLALDARRRGVDPATGKPPRTHAAREKLRRALQDEPARLERAFAALMEAYESAFGSEAADSFGKAIRAWHAGIKVVAEAKAALPPGAMDGEAAAARPDPATGESPAKPEASSRPHTRRTSSRLPVPTPLPAAVAAGHFGREEHGPVRPGADEVRAITEVHAEKLTDLLDGLRQVERDLGAPQCSDRARLYHERDRLRRLFQAGVAAYAESFGRPAAERLEAYVRRQLAQDEAGERGRGR